MSISRKLAVAGAATLLVGAAAWLTRPTLIYKGNVVKPGAMRSVVGLVYGEREARCTGTLLTSTIVLTAAHCVCGHWPSHVFVGDDTSERTGPLSGLYYAVKEVRTMLHCDSETSSTGVDMALVKLRDPVKSFVAPSFASDGIVSSASAYRVAGFGASSADGSLFEYRKQEAKVPSLTNSCSASDHTAYGCQVGEEIVAGRRGGADSCKGDSGGPLYVSEAGDAGEPSSNDLLLAGVVSRAVRKRDNECGSGGIYEKIGPARREWIRKAIIAMG